MQILKNLTFAVLYIYLLSLLISMAGMEISSFLLVVIFGAHWLYSYFKLKKQIYEPIGYEKFLGIFFLLAVVTAFINQQLTLDEQIFSIGNFRWIPLLLVITNVLLPYKEDLEKPLRFLFYASCIVAIFAIYQSFTGVDPFRDDINVSRSGDLWRAKAFFSSTMRYSYSYCMLFLFFFGIFLVKPDFITKKKWVFWSVASVLLVSLILTFTRGMWFSLLLSILIMTALVRWRLFLVSASSILIGGIVLYFSSASIQVRLQKIVHIQDGSTSDRFNIWKANWAMFQDHFWLGMGYRQNEYHLPEYYQKLGIASGFISHAHNMILQMLVGLGIFGGIIYVAFFILLIKQAYEYFRTSANQTLRAISLGYIGCVISMFIGGLTECNFQSKEVNHMFILFTAIFLVYAVKYKSKTSSKKCS